MQFLIIPLILFAIYVVIMLAVMKNRRRAPVTEQQDQNPVQTNEQPARSAAPARPAVRTPVSPYQTAYAAPKVQSAAKEAKQTDKNKKQDLNEIAPHPVTSSSPIVFSGSDAVKGIIYSEILGKPKALR